MKFKIGDILIQKRPLQSVGKIISIDVNADRYNIKWDDVEDVLSNSRLFIDTLCIKKPFDCNKFWVKFNEEIA